MAETLAPLVYGKVIGRFLAMVADGPAEDNDYPDGVPLSGDITFTPQVSSVIVPSATPAPATVLPMPIKATLDTDGYVTLNGKQGVYLLASNDPATEPTGYTYSVSFAGLRYNGGIVRYADFNITVLAGQTVDLSLVAPVGASTGTVVVADTTVLNRALLELETRTGATFTKVNQDVADARYVADNAYVLGTKGVADAATAQRKADAAYVKPGTGIPDADINGELVTNAKRGGDVYGRFDVSAQNVSQRDLNDITNSGQYRGYQMVNGPAQFPTGWWYIEVIKHDADWVFQRITGFTDAQAERTFVRHKNSGTWKSWVETGTYVKPAAGIAPADLSNDVVKMFGAQYTFGESHGAGGPGPWRIRLGVIDGRNEFAGAHAEFIISGTGDYGGAARGTLLVHAAQRGAGNITIKSWGWDVENTAGQQIELYAVKISDYSYELWCRTATFLQAHYVHVLAQGNMTWTFDKDTTDAPASSIPGTMVSMTTPYKVPATGIPEAQLSADVVTKLNKPSGTNVLVLASSTSTVPAGTPANTLVITPSSATA